MQAKATRDQDLADEVLLRVSPQSIEVGKIARELGRTSNTIVEVCTLLGVQGYGLRVSTPPECAQHVSQARRVVRVTRSKWKRVQNRAEKYMTTRKEAG